MKIKNVLAFCITLASFGCAKDEPETYQAFGCVINNVSDMPLGVDVDYDSIVDHLVLPEWTRDAQHGDEVLIAVYPDTPPLARVVKILPPEQNDCPGNHNPKTD